MFINNTTRIYMKGETADSSTGSGTSVYDPAQKQFYDELMNKSSEWLNSGGIDKGTDYSSNMKDSLNSAGDYYSNLMNGGIDEEALNGAMDANATAMTRQFSNTVMPALASSSNLTGNSSGSRRGISEGLAATNLNSQIGEQNQQMIWQANQDEIHNRTQGANGLMGVAKGYGNLSTYEQGQNNSGLESLLSYKKLIDGDIGGTEHKTWTGDGSAGSNGSWI